MSEPDLPKRSARFDGAAGACVASLCALLTCFNRREQTLACLQRLRLSADVAGLALHAVLVDDASTDGTADAVRSRFDWVTVLNGRDLYWNRGMHMAMVHAQAQRPEALWLWLNDDTMLDADALQRLLATQAVQRVQTGTEGIVVGATCDPVTGRLTYGGNRRGHGLRRFRFTRVHDPAQALACDTMNGNVVVLPRTVVDRIGLLDPCFEHALGDLDYGLRAVAVGVPVHVAPGFVGVCSNNSVSGTFDDPSATVRERWRRLLARKGLPWRSWLVFTRRHGGWAWPAFFIWPFLRVPTAGMFRRR